MKRSLDLLLCLFCFLIFFIPFLLIALMVYFVSPGPILFWSNRVGKNNIIFKMPKIRTMNPNAPDVATHLLKKPERYIIPFGSFLRHSSLDEIPQIWSIFKGDMSFVGPRPALHNQKDLISLRTKFGIHKLLPGLTGLAQIYGRDELPIMAKVNQDLIYLKKQSLIFDFKIIVITLQRIILKKNVKH